MELGCVSYGGWICWVNENKYSAVYLNRVCMCLCKRDTWDELERQREKKRVPLRLYGIPSQMSLTQSGAPLHSLQQPGNQRVKFSVWVKSISVLCWIASKFDRTVINFWMHENVNRPNSFCFFTRSVWYPHTHAHFIIHNNYIIN